MFYVNNKQVLGLFLNGWNYNFIAYGFGKIIPEDRNAEQLNLDLAYKYLNRYGVEYGTVKDGYENALVSPRMDAPDSNGVFHTPFTYYYNGNIVSTKNVPVLITDGNCALSNALVYSDMNINGGINHFANNTDFQGHNVNVFPEKEDSEEYQALLNYEMLNNCSNFDLNISTRFGKTAYPTLFNCNNFSGNFRYVGNQDIEYPGFRDFLHGCRDGVFNIDCTNMHGGGIFNIDDVNMSSGNVRKYFNFIGIQSCENMNVNITGSSWQVWPHDHSYSSNCNINTYNVISGFSYMNYCNFSVVLPKDSKPEMSQSFEFLNNAENCNYNLQALDSNLYSFRNCVWNLYLFQDLNNCNLNLLLNNSTGLDYAFGNRLNNCNIHFENMNFAANHYVWGHVNNCNITGSIANAEYSSLDLVAYSTNVNLNVDASSANNFGLIWNSSYVNGNVILGNNACIHHSNNLILDLYNGSSFDVTNVEHSYLRAYNTTFSCRNTNDTNIYGEGGSTITGADNCYNLTLSGLTPDGESLFENVYKSNLKFGTDNPYYRLWHVESCTIGGFPRALAYVKNCVFYPFTMRYVGQSNSEVGTWSNVWTHIKTAGIRSNDSISNCRIYANYWTNSGSETFSNINNMQTSFGSYYSGVVTANLPIYNVAIKLNVDCNTLNLGIIQAGPPHGFQNATISADTIYAKENNSGACVQVRCDTKIYCENYCNVCFQPYIDNYNNVLQPVILINNFQHSNYIACNFLGGLTRIGRLNYQGGAPASLTLINGACVFINNAVLGSTVVSQNSMLFLGSNVTRTSGITVESGGRVRNAANLTNDDIRFIDRGQLCWNLLDYGPWGSERLIDYCTSV